MLKAESFFELSESRFADLFIDTEYVWDALKNIKPYIRSKLKPNVSDIRDGDVLVAQTTVLYQGEVLKAGFTIDSSGKKPVVKKDGQVLDGASIIFAGASLMDDDIFIGEGTIIEPGALIKGQTIIGDYTEIRHGAYLRGDCLIGDHCVVGHTTEVKSAVMLGETKAGHFAYIGDSVLGKVNLGAGTKLANLKIFESKVTVKVGDQKYDTGLTKFGAILGDGVESGCNSVTAPGSVISKNVLIYSNVAVRGYYKPNKIIKGVPNLPVENLK